MHVKRTNLCIKNRINESIPGYTASAVVIASWGQVPRMATWNKPLRYVNHVWEEEKQKQSVFFLLLAYWKKIWWRVRDVGIALNCLLLLLIKITLTIRRVHSKQENYFIAKVHTPWEDGRQLRGAEGRWHAEAAARSRPPTTAHSARREKNLYLVNCHLKG